MSYMEMLALNPKKKQVQDSLAEFRNAHHGAGILWSDIVENYLGLERSAWLTTNDAIWKQMREAIPERLKYVLDMTYDNAYLLKKDYQRAAADIQFYLDIAGERTEKCFKDDCGHLYTDQKPHTVVKYGSHWNSIKKVIEQATCPAIGFYWMSCGEDLWRLWDDKKDKQGAIDWKSKFEVYAEAKVQK